MTKFNVSLYFLRVLGDEVADNSDSDVFRGEAVASFKICNLLMLQTACWSLYFQLSTEKPLKCWLVAQCYHC